MDTADKQEANQVATELIQIESPLADKATIEIQDGEQRSTEVISASFVKSPLQNASNVKIAPLIEYNDPSQTMDLAETGAQAEVFNSLEKEQEARDLSFDRLNESQTSKKGLLQIDEYSNDKKQTTTSFLPPIQEGVLRNSQNHDSNESRPNIKSPTKSKEQNISPNRKRAVKLDSDAEEPHHDHSANQKDDSMSDMGGSDYSGSDDGSGSESSDEMDETFRGDKSTILGKGLNAMTENKLMKGLGSGIGAIGKGIGGLAGFGEGAIEEDRSDEKTPADLKKIFMDKYSIQLEIPSQDIQNSHFYPTNSNYLMQVEKYNLPQGEDYSVTTYHLDGTRKTQKFGEVYQEKKDGIILRLVKQDEDLNDCVIQDYAVIKELIPMKKNEKEPQFVSSAQITFSPDGKFFFIYMKQLDTLMIYEIKDNDIEKLMEDIKNKNYMYKYDDDDLEIDTLAFVKFMKVDINSKYIGLIGKQKIMIIDILNQKNMKKKPYEFDIQKYPQSRLENIYDVHIESTDNNHHPIKCFLACKIVGHKKIKIIDTYGHGTNDNRVLNYFNDKASNFNIKIIHKAGDIIAILANGLENFILECKKDGTTKQRNLSQLNNMQVHYIQSSVCYEDGFYIVASHAYDQCLTVLNSEITSFEVNIKRNVLPGIITVYDMMISNFSHDTQHIRVASLLDDEFVVDKIDREKFTHEQQMQLDDKPQSPKQPIGQTNSFLSSQLIALATLRPRRVKILSFKFSSISAFSTCWPYICFSGLGPYMLVCNVFDKEHLHRIQIGELNKSCKICKSFISDTKDLFVMTLKDGVYMMYTLDLDNLNFFKQKKSHHQKFELLFKYDDDYVNFKELKDIHVRGSSRKEVIQLNQKLIVFMLHDESIYSWIDQTEDQDLREKNTIVKVNKTHEHVISKSFQVVDNNLFYYHSETGNKSDDQVTQEIVKCEVLFGEYLISQEYLEVSQQLQLMGFNIDQSTQNLLLIMRPFTAVKGGKNTIYLKIWDSLEDRMIFESYLQNANLQGVFESEAFSFVGNHIYYNNNVIKIRIDLMKQHKRNMTEQQLYCEYNDIFIMEKGNRVKINSPLQAVGSHKFTYIIYSPPSKPQPKKLMIMPYLHERKIYLNRMKMNTKYFYTTFKTDNHCINTNSIRKEKDIHLSSKTIMDDQDKLENLSNEYNEILIACLNLVESKVYLYRENGQLVNRCDFVKQIKEYGDIVSTSNDGLNYIFKKKNKSEFSILELSFQGFKFIKKIDIIDFLKKYAEANGLKDQHDLLFDEDSWINDHKRCIYTFMLNNNQDVVIKIKQNQGLRDKNNAKNVVDKNDSQVSTVLFFIAGWYDSEGQILSKKTKVRDNSFNVFGLGHFDEQAMGILVVRDLKRLEMAINSRYLFIWDKKKIEFYDLKHPMTKENKLYVNFRISQTQRNAYIKEIVTGNDPDKIAIVVEQLQDSTIFSWDIAENFENEAFNIEKDHSIIFDSKGNINILDCDCLTISQQLCRIKAFQIDDFTSRENTIHQKSGSSLGYSQGVRFDSEGNNWLILREYIMLPFSYMTFVIKEEMEDVNDFSNYAFDIEPYNYVINQTTCFLDGDLSRKNYLQLNYILKNFEKENLEYLELLHYTKMRQVVDVKSQSIMGNIGDIANSMKNKVDVMNVFGKKNTHMEMVSPLSLALKEGNNRCVEIILSFMAKIDYNASSKFVDEMPFLTDYNSFSTYLTELPMQTQQMLEKQILKIAQPWDDEIVSIADSQCVYIDDDFYKLKMFEDKFNPSYKSIPVKMEAMKVGWIINTDQGRLLLQNILNSERLDYFDIPSLVMVIEFLYQRNKVLIIAMPLPMYIIQGIAFLMTIYVSEETAAKFQNSRTLDNDYLGDTELSSAANNSRLRTISIVNLSMTILQLLIMVQMFKKMGIKFFQRTYTWFDLIFYVFNTLVFSRIYNPSPSMQYQRIFETFGVIFFLIKTFYFLKLADKVAPLVSIVFSILYDIRYFMIILIMAIVCFAMAFYLEGLNQMDKIFDQVAAANMAHSAASKHLIVLKKAAEAAAAAAAAAAPSGGSSLLASAPSVDPIIASAEKLVTSAWASYQNELSNQANTPILEYSSFSVSIWYLWNVALGAGDPSGFQDCDDIECSILIWLYVLSTFVFILHLFNMLIAIMGDTFAKNNEVQNQIKIKDHLGFVLDNWYLNELQKEKTMQIKYIMSAFAIHDETDDTEIIRAVYDRVDELDEVMTKTLTAISKKQNEQDSFLRLIIKNQDRILNGQNHMEKDMHKDKKEYQTAM